MSSHNDSFVASGNSPTKPSKPDSSIESLEKLNQEAELISTLLCLVRTRALVQSRGSKEIKKPGSG